MARGLLQLTNPWQTKNTIKWFLGRQTAGANVRCQEGNNPDRQLRSLIMSKWERRWIFTDNQEVGLEAAIP